MCGIAGTVSGASPDPEVLGRMAERMAHRGPDWQGVWLDEVAGLAIRRLAIIDLDPRSNQPFHHGPWHLVFNGEIYNYRELRDELRGLGHHFVTEGDGEVLLHAWVEWEDSALDRLNGMFALAIWNDERRELVCACDLFGEKPLFWATDGDRIAFASDIRALFEARPDLGAPRPEVLAPYLALSKMPPIDRSFFAGVERLPGAHLLRFRDGRAKVRRYWQPQRVEVPAEFGEAADELCALLFDSIRLRLRSDVPVGTSLSGGIDSSAIVGLAASIAGDHRRHAFTARFPGFERDEWHYAEVVAQAAGVLEHHSVAPTADELLADLDALVNFQEEPFGSASIYAQWRVMRAAREAGVTVLLDGQGADELFAGYQGVSAWALRTLGPAAMLRGLASPRERKSLALVLGSQVAPEAAAIRYRRRKSTPYAAVTVRNEAATHGAPALGIDGQRTPLERELLRQTLHTSLPELLRYADRSSMAHSREVRLPFLDRRVAEFALSLPADFLYRDGLTKAVLREAVRGVVPAEILARRDKVGYEPPQARWFSEPAFVARIREVLLDPRARGRGLYEAAAIEADARAGRWRDPSGIWRALNLELWLNAFASSPRAVASAVA
jgi:asparagine synthase (glutamine-hydrolysing)